MKRVWICFLAALLGLQLFVTPAKADWDVPGKGAVLMEAATGTILYEKNAHEKFSPASVTKVMTMLLIMEAIDGGRISWEDTVTASDTASAKGGSQIYLKAGETMSVRDLVKSIAVSSANDAACAMAEFLAGSEAAFVSQMNQRAAELGMNDTHFVNCTGLDDAPEAKEHLTSAYDIALMSRQLLVYHPDIKNFTTIWMDTVRDGAFGLSNTNKLVRFYDGCTGLKTGYTSGAGFCLSASASREGMELIAVVLGCETSQDRFNACRTMLDYGFANYTLVTPEIPEAQQVAVRLGTATSVEAIPGQQVQFLLEKGQKNAVSTQITLEPELDAPVSKGQRVGILTVRVGEQVLAQVSMVAAEAVPRLTFGELFLLVLKAAVMG